MYLRSASEDQRPITMIMNTGVSSMNIAIAAAEQIDYIPISPRSTPNLSFPMLSAVLRSVSRTSSCENSMRFPRW